MSPMTWHCQSLGAGRDPGSGSELDLENDLGLGCGHSSDKGSAHFAQAACRH
jgi:hypothetical protein